MATSFEFDAPVFQDFTALNLIGENDSNDDSDWFQKQEIQTNAQRIAVPDPTKGSMEETEDVASKNHKNEARDSCPSPKKRQKVCNMAEAPSQNNSTPRRSPRFLNKPQQQMRKPSQSPLRNKSNNLTRAVSQPNVAFAKDSGKEKGKNVPPVKGIKGKCSLELELEMIAKMKEKLAASRKRNQDLYKAAISSKPVLLHKSRQPVTLPEDFHFQSDQRIRGLPEHVPETKVKDFTAMLRDGSSQPVVRQPKLPLTLTCPQPFKLSQAKNTIALHAAEKYESVAEKVAAFHAKTPDRFKSKAVKRSTSRLPHLIVAKTPTLTTRGRARSVKTLSQQEREEADFNEHQKQQFKAHPVNHRILAVPHVGVYKVPSKATTIPQEFNLYQNAGSHLQAEAEEEKEDRGFHANPLNPKIFIGPVGVKPAVRQPLTIPQSPAFALRSRVRLPMQEPKQEHAPAPTKYHHVPHAGVPFRPKLEHTYTVPQSFAVEERSKQMLKKKEEKIMQVYEEEKKAREFHANLLPSDEPDTLPLKQLRPTTEPEPFNLEVDSRGQRYQEEYMHKQIEEESRQAKTRAEFKACPNKVMFKSPFIPEKSFKPLTEVDSFALNTDTRAVKREIYNQHSKAHEAEVTALKRQIDERRQQEENSAVAKLRQDMVHKATVIRRYKSVQVLPSDRPLTEPQSPMLHTQRKQDLDH